MVGVAHATDLTAWAFPGHDPRGPDSAACWLAFERTLMLIDQALPHDCVLVKGAAPALSSYPSPLERPMGDIDVLVPSSLVGVATEALVRGDFREVDVGRPLTKRYLDQKLLAPMAAVPVLVELHAGLDKVVARAVDYRGIFARSTPAPGMRRLRVPSPEDHVLLIALHLAVDDFAHRPGFADLALLLRQGADLAVCADRAERWGLRSALGLSLDLLETLAPGTVPAAIRLRLGGAGVRRRVQRRVFSVPSDDPPPRALGGPWILRQTLLRDDPVRWAAGLGTYAAKRVVERVVAPVGRRSRDKTSTT